MPLPIAHGLLGASVVAAIIPTPASIFSKDYLKSLLFGAFLANAADFDFALVIIFRSIEWHRGFSHSIAFALCIALVFILYFGKQDFRKGLAYAAAFASHFVLDFATTKIGGGLELLFPFSTERFGLRWFSLSEVPSKLAALEILKALTIEFAIFFFLLSTILITKCFLVRFYNRKIKSNKIPNV